MQLSKECWHPVDMVGNEYYRKSEKLPLRWYCSKLWSMDQRKLRSGLRKKLTHALPERAARTGHSWHFQCSPRKHTHPGPQKSSYGLLMIQLWTVCSLSSLIVHWEHWQRWGGCMWSTTISIFALGCLDDFQKWIDSCQRTQFLG